MLTSVHRRNQHCPLQGIPILDLVKCSGMLLFYLNGIRSTHFMVILTVLRIPDYKIVSFSEMEVRKNGQSRDTGAHEGNSKHRCPSSEDHL